MNKLLQHRYLVRENLVTLIGISLCFYFAYHTVSGERSVIRLGSLKQQIATMSQDYADLKQERFSLEQKVQMMRPGSINRDLLEERARLTLGYQNEDEISIRRN
jgi:cell division protein FtsB